MKIRIKTLMIGIAVVALMLAFSRWLNRLDPIGRIAVFALLLGMLSFAMSIVLVVLVILRNLYVAIFQTEWWIKSPAWTRRVPSSLPIHHEIRYHSDRQSKENAS